MPSSKITLIKLIDAGIIEPGVGVLTILHKNKLIATADLNDDGTVTWGPQRRISLNRFAVKVMNRSTNAWLTVLYNDLPLDTYRDKFKLLREPREHPFELPESWSDDGWFGSTQKGRQLALDILTSIIKKRGSVESILSATHVSKARYVYGVMNRLIDESYL